MPILVNDKELDLSNPKSKVEKEVVNGIKEILGKKKPFRFIRESVYRKKLKLDNNGRPVLPAPLSFQLTQSVKNNGVTERWVYCKNPKYNKTTGKPEYTPSLFSIVSDIVVKPAEEPEKVYFLTKVMDMPSLGVYIEDKEQEAKDKQLKQTARRDVEYMIFNERSPLTREDFLLLAMSLGLSGIDDMSDSLLKETLWEKVQDNNNKNITTFAQFLKDCDTMGDNVRVSAYVNKAFEDKMVGLEGLSIYYMDNNHKIMTIPSTRLSKPREALIDYFLRNRKELDLFMESVEEKTKDTTYSLEDIKAMNLFEAKKAIKEATNEKLVFSITATKDDVVESYKKWLTK
jgi:hypothetical protein